MPPDEPAAPTPGPRDTGGTATYGGAAEAPRPEAPPATPSPTSGGDAPSSTPDAPSPAGPPPAEPAADAIAPKVAAPTRRRFLDDPDPDAPKAPKAPPRPRARKVRRVLRHIDPWSVLKVSVLFFLSLFLIFCVASAVLWSAARSAGVVDDAESFITSLGFGNCEDIAGEDTSDTPVTSTTIDGSQPQLGGSSTTVPAAVEEPDDQRSTIPDEDGECAEGQRLVGGFEFEDGRIFQSFALGGLVLVLSGAAFSVLMALLFNLISDLTGGVRVTVLEEEPARRSGSPAPPARD